MDAGDAAGEAVGGVEERGVGVGDLDAALQQRGRDLAGARRRLALAEQRHGASRPHRPVSEQPADDPALDRPPADGEPEGRHQVGDDGVVVAGVERDVVAAGVDDGADHVEGLIAVERRDLDGDDGRYLGEAAPEGVRQRSAAHRGLQVEADERDAGADRRAVRDERGVVRVGQRGQAEQAGVVAEARQQIRLRQGLVACAADAADADERFGARSASARSISSAASVSTGSNRPIAGSRIANCVVCTPTARPPPPAAT